MSERVESWTWDPVRGLVPPGALAGSEELLPPVAPAPLPPHEPRRRGGRHAAPVGRRRRLVRRTVAAGTAVCLVSAGVVTTLPSASAAGPVNVLQTVDVSLGGDGSVTAVRTTDLSRDVHSRISSTQRTLDPADAVASLPVVVSLSYLLDGKPGTDLNRVKGKKGLVELDLTVTNATGHGEAFSVDAAGQHTDTDALVTTPLTVVGTASLPRDSFSSIVRSDGGSDAPHTTNGVLVDGTDGKAKVQWASVLAPPRLDGSSTFSLVEQTDSFALPDLQLSVQPGLTADPSVEQLLSKAFGQQSPLTTLQSSTAQLTDDVSKELSAVSDLLHQISTALVDSSTAAGTQTQELKGTAKDAGSQLDDLVSSLGSLGERVKGQLASAQTTGDDALQATLQSLLDYIGVSEATAPTASPTVAAADCGSGAPADAPATTLYAQLSRIAAVLQQASVASGGCIATTRTALAAAIGGTTTCPATAPPAGTALPLTCELDATRSSLSAISTQLVSRAQGVLTDLGGTGLPQIGSDLTSMAEAVSDLQRAASALVASSGPLGDVASAIRDLQQQVTSIESSTSPTGSTGLGADLAAVHTAAVAQRDAIGVDSDAATTGSLSGQLKSLAAGICATPSVPAEVQPAVASYASELRNRIDRGQCAGVAVDPGASPPTPLATIASVDHAAWSTVAGETDAGAASPTGPARDLLDLHNQAVTVQSSLSSLLATLSVPSGPVSSATLAAALYDVADKVKGLYDPGVVVPSGCPVSVPDGAPLNRLQATFAMVSCKQTSVAGELSSLVTDAPVSLGALGTQLQGASGQGAAAQRSADTALAGLLGTLTNSFSGAATAEVAQGHAALATQSATLKQAVATSSTHLDSGVASSIAELRKSLSSTTVGLSDVKSTLTGGIQTVLGQLGSPTTGGLLGRIQDQGHQVQSQGVDGVQAVGDRANGFTDVQSTDALAQALVQQQVDRGLTQVSSVTHLGPKLPTGSTSTSVFSFRLTGA